MAFIALFWADVDTRGGHGTVFFRSTTNPTTLALIKDVVSSSQAGVDLAARFNPKWALVATWEEVGYFSGKGDMVSKRRSMQSCQDSGVVTLWLPKPHLVTLCSPRSSLDDLHVQTLFQPHLTDLPIISNTINVKHFAVEIITLRKYSPRIVHHVILVTLDFVIGSLWNFFQFCVTTR